MDASRFRSAGASPEHSLMQISEGPDMTVGDVCGGCSDPDNGVWVPVSFCEDAAKWAADYYKELYGY